jgi:pimeloyl-ACP methyl ester carboxylesterase
MTDVPETRYAKTTNGVHIAYQVVGKRPLDLVFVPPFISHLDLFWEDPDIARFYRRLASFSRLILFDKRGVGLSDRVAFAHLEQRMDDLRAVMDAVGSERATICGMSEGAAMSVLFAATYPERTRSLVLCGPSVKLVSTEDFPYGYPRKDIAAFYDACVDAWGQGTSTLGVFSPSVLSDPEKLQWAARLERQSASPGALRVLGEMNLDIDIRGVLSSVHVPTLIIQATDDVVAPVGQARYVAERIPGAKYIEVAGIDHVPWTGDAETVLGEIEEFLTGERHGPTADRVLATVLFTDIVGSTEQDAQRGDRAWRELLDRHDLMVSEELRQFRGRQVKSTGDGVLATFDGPARAMRCARAIQVRAERLGVKVRAGLHTGEVELRGDDHDVSGIAVHIAQRVSALARPGEVLVSRTVTDLVAGSGIEFADRGEHELKGVPGTWRLFAVEG